MTRASNSFKKLDFDEMRRDGESWPDRILYFSLAGRVLEVRKLEKYQDSYTMQARTVAQVKQRFAWTGMQQTAFSALGFHLSL